MRVAGPPSWVLAFGVIFLALGVLRLTLLGGGSWEPALGLSQIGIGLLWLAGWLRMRQLSRRPTRGPEPHVPPHPARHSTRAPRQ
ncbi:hypothetical protein [Serinibacter arcticus]|uniref:Uncharacterized protein n=1 Tax=Serinibacter arcticus TaxID=1655435 RepID=A0A4Z1E4C4_9MICO|nr:hypothetical protein [Serinibacter arcticus]TGO04597.1 hypothetical protein SERN_2190 [Serinibacter arcticus]